MIICNQCGNPLAEGLRFCTECGAPLLGLSPEQPKPTVSYAPHLPPAEPHVAMAPVAQPERNTNLLPWILIPSALLIGIVIFAIYQSSKPGVVSGNLTSGSSSYQTNENSRGRASEVNTNRSFNSSRASNTTATNSSNINAQPSNSNMNSNEQDRVRAYCNANSLMVRSEPVLDLNKRNVIGELSRGDEVWIIRESSNYDTYNGITSNWAEVQLVQRPLRGWVFKYYLASGEGE